MKSSNVFSVIMWIVYLTILDVILTLYGLQIGIIEEANPILKLMFQKTPFWTGAGIVFFVYFLLWFLYSVQDQVRWLAPALWLICIIKLSVITMHLNWLFNM